MENIGSALTHCVDLVSNASPLAYTAWGAGALMAALLFRPFFGDLSGFGECIRYWLRPDIFSFFRGEWDEDRWAELKLFVWVALSAITGFAAYYKLPKLFPSAFPA